MPNMRDLGLAFSGVGRDYVQGIVLKSQLDALRKEQQLNELLMNAKIEAMKKEQGFKERELGMAEETAGQQKQLFTIQKPMMEAGAGAETAKSNVLKAILEGKGGQTEEQLIAAGVMGPKKPENFWQKEYWENKNIPVEEKAAMLSRFNLEKGDAEVIAMNALKKADPDKFLDVAKEYLKGKSKLADALNKMKFGAGLRQSFEEEVKQPFSLKVKLDDRINDIKKSVDLDPEEKTKAILAEVATHNKRMKEMKQPQDWSAAAAPLMELKKKWDAESFQSAKEDLEPGFISRTFKKNMQRHPETGLTVSENPEDITGTSRQLEIISSYWSQLEDAGIDQETIQKILEGWVGDPNSRVGKYIQKMKKGKK